MNIVHPLQPVNGLNPEDVFSNNAARLFGDGNGRRRAFDHGRGDHIMIRKEEVVKERPGQMERNL